MSIFINRRVIIDRFVHFLNNITTITQSGSYNLDNLEISLSSSNFSDELIENVIRDLHKYTHKVNPNNPIYLENDVEFIGCSKVGIKLALETADQMFDKWKTVEGITVYAFKRHGSIYFLPTINIFVNGNPSLLSWKYSFKLGTPLPKNVDVNDLLVLKISDNFIDKMPKFLFSNLESNDELVSGILFDIKDKYVLRRRTPDLTNAIERFGYQSKIADMVYDFLYTPIMNIEGDSISTLLVTENGVINSKTYEEFINGNSSAIILHYELSHELYYDDFDPNLYNFGGKDYYVEDQGWELNEKGGYTTKYTVVAESYTPDLIDGMNYFVYPKESYGEGLGATVIEGGKSLASGLAKTFKKIKNKIKDNIKKREMYNLFTREIYDEIIQAEQKKKVIRNSLIGATRSKNEDVVDSINNAIMYGALTAASLPKKKETNEGLQKIKKYYTEELEKYQKEKEEIIQSKTNIKRLKRLSKEIAFVTNLLDRIGIEENKRIEKAKSVLESSGEGSSLFGSKNKKTQQPTEEDIISDKMLKTSLGKFNQAMSITSLLVEIVKANGGINNKNLKPMVYLTLEQYYDQYLYNFKPDSKKEMLDEIEENIKKDPEFLGYHLPAWLLCPRKEDYLNNEFLDGVIKDLAIIADNTPPTLTYLINAFRNDLPKFINNYRKLWFEVNTEAYKLQQKYGKKDE